MAGAREAKDMVATLGSMNRRKFCILTALAAAIPSMLLEGCESQQTIADLINTLGSAAVQLATYESNPTLAAKLQADVAAASQAVLGWKKGTPGDMVVEALNLVEDDLNLFPMAGPYVPLIDLAIITVEQILISLKLATPVTGGPKSVGAPATQHRRRVITGYKAPKNSKEFKEKWDSLAPQPVKIAK